jgi:outer membrane protein OmpA-like peptidoglycan-associated protein
MAEDSGAVHDSSHEREHVHEHVTEAPNTFPQAASPYEEPQLPLSLLGDSRLRQTQNLPVRISLMRQAQQTFGNRALRRMVQTKISVGAAQDAYEQEADRVADQVMAMPSSPGDTHPVQRSAEADEPEMDLAEAASAQPNPKAPSIARIVQREAADGDEGIDEDQQKKKQDDEGVVQTKRLSASITPYVQREDDDEQPKKHDEDEGVVQTKPLAASITPVLQREASAEAAGDGSFDAGSEFESGLASASGGGSPLPDSVRSFMEPRFGADFGGVRIHTGAHSEHLNRQVSAQAFTHGADIFMGDGKYQPDSAQGRHLLAHELTHVVQQGGAGELHNTSPAQRRVARKPAASWGKQGAINRSISQPMWGRQSSIQRQPGAGSPVAVGRGASWGRVQRDLSEQDKKDYEKFVGSSYAWPNRTAGVNGKFDVLYSPAGRQMDVTVKVKFEFPDVTGTTDADKKVMDDYRANYISQVQKAWSKRYQFQNVREPQEAWKKLNPVTVNVQVQEVKSNQHFLIQAYIKKTGTAQVSGGNSGAFNKTELFKGDDTPTARFNPGTEQGELARVARINPSPILFDNNKADIKADVTPKLSFMATYMKRISNPKFDITITGHANNTGTKTYNQGLAEQRAKNVETALKAGGLTNHNMSSSSAGSTGATAGAEWRKVDINVKIPAGWKNEQDVTPHEFGHMIGLGDEYGGGANAKATHYDLVVKAFGKEYADQVAKRGDTDYASIMEGGNDVRIQHYVTFWEALCETTLQKAAAPTKRFGYDDWKFIG